MGSGWFFACVVENVFEGEGEGMWSSGSASEFVVDNICVVQ